MSRSEGEGGRGSKFCLLEKSVLAAIGHASASSFSSP